MKPFRWNIKKREQLGSLLNTEAQVAYPEYTDQLAECASHVVARSSNKRIVFVGRSPENIFDYLSGVFHDTRWETRIDLLNISNRFREVDDIKNELPDAYQALKDHFMALEIDPAHVISDSTGLCFSDLVARGGTLQRLFDFIEKWTLEEKQDLRAVATKLGFVGITQRTKNSPNTWRWQQNADWILRHPKLTVKNVSIPHQLWHYLGNMQRKVAKTNFPERWAGDEAMLPPREEGNIKALKQAQQIFSFGLTQKNSFAGRLSICQEFREPWLRSLVTELKRGSQQSM